MGAERPTEGRVTPADILLSDSRQTSGLLDKEFLWLQNTESVATYYGGHRKLVQVPRLG